MVVKISSRPTIEHRTMARLEHSNIVPILSVHREDKTEFQAVCMPYQHAVALSDLREGWTAQTLGDNRAETYLRSVRDALPERLPSDADAVAEFPARQDFVYATAWIMHKLAGALNHAHLRGIYHRDLKPSNILLTASGQPLLVDFNLSFDRLESASSNAKMVGGTLAYMPAEQIQALHPIEPGRVDDVGPRADIFSLAVTVFEMLTGRLPFGAPTREADKLAALLSQLAKRFTAVPNVREFNPLVPPDLADLIAKCLDPLPHRRYDTAAVLADDLARFLQDRPMRHVPMIPWRSRLRKFTRRNRRRLLSSAAITTAVAAASIAIAHSYHRAHIERVARKHSDLLASQLQTNADKEADQALARRLKVPDDGQNFYRSFVLGREYFLARRYGVALRCFTVSRSLREDYAPTYFYRARSLANLDMDDEALKDFSKAIDLDPNDLYSFLARAVFYASSVTHADPYQALADIEMAQQLMPRTEVERNKALYLEMARVFSAVSRLVVADEREPILIKAEENLVKALQLGLEVHFVNEAAASDRFRMLGPVLNRPRMASLLSELSLSEEKH